MHHQFTAYDCEHPSSVQALKLPSHCLNNNHKQDSTQTTDNLTITDNQPYELLQKVTYHEFEAHMCIQTCSKFFYSCVWASHSIVNNVPQTGRHVSTSLDFCAESIKTGMFTTESGRQVSLNDDSQVTYITETIKGDINVRPKGFVTCNGEDVRFHGQVLKQIVMLQETHFTTKKVKLRNNFDTEEIMIVETGTTIPAHLSSTGGFIIDSGTYVVPKVENPCTYQTIKTFMGTPQPTSVEAGLVITSQKDMVHVHTHGTLNPPENCPIQGQYRRTGHPNIVVFEPMGGLTAPETTLSPIDP